MLTYFCLCQSKFLHSRSCWWVSKVCWDWFDSEYLEDWLNRS